MQESISFSYTPHIIEDSFVALRVRVMVQEGFCVFVLSCHQVGNRWNPLNPPVVLQCAPFSKKPAKEARQRHADLEMTRRQKYMIHRHKLKIDVQLFLITPWLITMLLLWVFMSSISDQFRDDYYYFSSGAFSSCITLTLELD